MKRLAVFAHFDSHNKIEDYVIYYLKELKKVAQDIIFVSDCNLPEDELNKIKNYTIKNIAKHHGEYDFGSYKRGFIFAKENYLLDTIDELIFANDSCYAPLFDFNEMFEKMSKKECDFWGATSNQNSILINTQDPTNDFHIQSFFLSFKKQIFNDMNFENFINSIKKEDTKQAVIEKYEIGLSKLLINKGFKPEVYSKQCKIYTHCHIAHWKKLILKDRLPFLKRSVSLFKNPEIALPINLKNTINKTQYNWEIIDNDIKNNATKLSIKQKIECLFCITRKNLPAINLKRRNVVFLMKEYKI